MTVESLSLTDLRPRISELIDRAGLFFDRFLITRRGKAEAVLMAVEDYEGLMETLEILSDDRQVRRLAEAELARGEGHSLESIRRQLLDAPSG